MSPGGFDRRRRLPELDGVRGLAILLVVIWHYVGSPLQREPGLAANAASHALRLTGSGVNLFFVLSGFLIGGILLDERESPGYFRAFYTRRAFRILPLYFVWLAAFFFVTFGSPAWTSSPAFGHLFQHPFPAWSYGTFTQNLVAARLETLGPNWLGITWSLAVEEQFYLLLPVMVRFIAPTRFPLLIAALAVGAPIFRVLGENHSRFAGMVLMPCQGDSLWLGVLCAVALRSERGRSIILRARWALYASLGILISGLGAFCALSSHFEDGPYLYSVLAISFAITLVLSVTDQRGPVSWFFRQRWIRFLGTIAYGVYLMHQAVNGLLHGWVLGQRPAFGSLAEVAVTSTAVAVTILLAAISWTKFEKPLVAVGHSVGYGDGPRGGRVAAVLERAQT